MPLAFDDPYDGGVPDVTLGQSKITPRETYGVDPHALNERYADKMKNANQLFEALSQFAGSVGGLEKQAQQNQVDQAAAIAAQVGDSIKNGENVDLKLGTLRPDLSPLARNAVAEIIGKQRGLADAQLAFENMPLEARNDPAKAQAYFNDIVKQSALDNAGSPFYNNARTKALQGAFAGFSSALSNQRVQKMVELQTQDSKQTFEQTAMDIATKYRENPATFSPTAVQTPTGARELAAKIVEPGATIKVPGTSYQIQSQVTPEGAALLRTITRSEAGSAGNPYTLQVGGKHFTDFSDHPREFTVNWGRGPSSASGAYQFTKTTWDEYCKRYADQFTPGPNGKIPFTPANQDRMAWLLAQDRYARLTGGRSLQTDLQSPMEHQRILKTLSAEWTSLPGGLEPNKATNGQFAALTNEVARARSGKPASASAPTTSDPAAPGQPQPPSASTTGQAALAFADPNATPAAPQPAADTSPKVKDYAGRPEGVLPPQVQHMRDTLFTEDQMQNFTHPNVQNAEKRDHMVEAVMNAAIRTNDKDWLKAVPDKILTPELRDKMIKAEALIQKNIYTQHEQQRKMQEEARTDAMRQWNTEANAWIIQHPNEPPPADMIMKAFSIDPSLLETFNSRQLAVQKGVTNPKVEDRNVQALEERMIAIAAAGGDARRVDINAIIDPAKHQKLLEFGNELAKTGGEMSNDFYTKQWAKDAQSLYGFQLGVPLVGGQKSDPTQVETDHDFQKNLSRRIAAYAAQHGGPINNLQRMEIYEQALDDTKRIHKPTNDAGPRVSGSGNPAMGDPEQDRLKAAQKKYKLGE